MSPSIDKALIGLSDMTQRRGQKITARDVATATLAIAALRHLDDSAQHNLRGYCDALRTSIERGIQLDATREMLGQIREILE